MKVSYAVGLVNYCVPAGEAHLKALEIAQHINQKVQIFIFSDSSTKEKLKT